MSYGYPNLYITCGWKPGVYKAPPGYEHAWLCVTPEGTTGHWTRKEAREAYRLSKEEVTKYKIPRSWWSGQTQ